jgi:hypothetical protein
VRCCVALGADVVGLETCHLGAPGTLDVERLGDALGPAGAVFSWGHPYGLSYGSDGAAERDLLDWIDLPPAVATPCCGSSSRTRTCGGTSCRRSSCGPPPRPCGGSRLGPLPQGRPRGGEPRRPDGRGAAGAGPTRGLPAMAVCFDVVNAVRVRDDVVDAAALLADHVVMAHLKDLVDAPWAPGVRTGHHSPPGPGCSLCGPSSTCWCRASGAGSCWSSWATSVAVWRTSRSSSPAGCPGCGPRCGQRLSVATPVVGVVTTVLRPVRRGDAAGFRAERLAAGRRVQALLQDVAECHLAGVVRLLGGGGGSRQ